MKGSKINEAIDEEVMHKLQIEINSFFDEVTSFEVDEKLTKGLQILSKLISDNTLQQYDIGNKGEIEGMIAASK